MKTTNAIESANYLRIIEFEKNTPLQKADTIFEFIKTDNGWEKCYTPPDYPALPDGTKIRQDKHAHQNILREVCDVLRGIEKRQSPCMVSFTVANWSKEKEVA